MTKEVNIPCEALVRKFRGNLPGFTTLYPKNFIPGDAEAAVRFRQQHCQDCSARITREPFPLPRMENYRIGECTGLASISGGEIKTSQTN